MSLFRCKMCGGTLEIHEHEGVAECEYCGTLQTLPKNNDETIQNLFSRANNLRFKCEFDKAEQIYEKILELDNSEAEAHWGIILCKYGIEYVEDPKTFKRIPTCHRTSFESVTSNAEYLAAMEYADYAQKRIYEQEAKAIDAIQRSILNIVKNEKPFDVFLCYKETDENGRRTVDSTIANGIYYQLNEEGFKVFYAAITLEDKLGMEYEPYIFAALNSAKVMLVIGTKPEYFEAVWVKNEWSRFMKLMKTDRSKLLIPCYKDMDAYDLPDEFAHLQAQDMSKIGFINDITRGIKKVLEPKQNKDFAQAVSAPAMENTSISPLLKRAFMFLEDGDFQSADEYCEKVLDNDPECAEAYLGKLMVELKVQKREQLAAVAEPFTGSGNYKKAIRFADTKLSAELGYYLEEIKRRKENERFEKVYAQGVAAMRTAKNENDFNNAAKYFDNIPKYKDSAALAEDCRRKAEEIAKDTKYSEAEALFKKGDSKSVKKAKAIYESLSGWKDSEEKLALCDEKALEATHREETAKIKKERKAEDRKGVAKIAIPFVAVALAAAILVVFVLSPVLDYNNAIKLMESGDYEAAGAAFAEMEDYKDSSALITECDYQIAVGLMENGEYDKAIEAFKNLDGYGESEQNILKATYMKATYLSDNEKYEEAIIVFESVNNYKDSETQIENCKTGIFEREYQKAVALAAEKKYDEAIEIFKSLEGYKDSEEQAITLKWGSMKVGDIITFGSYEQDNDLENGKEPIEWQVLDVQDGKALVISKYGLINKPYNVAMTNITWETCTLRKWLNNEFINSVFSSKERDMIITTKLSNPDNPKYGTNGGNDTEDKVFLLSINEANKYFSSDEERKCKPSVYAKEKGIRIADNGNCWWWLRSPGNYQDCAADVYADCRVAENGGMVNSDSIAVRPALWIDLLAVE